MEHNERVSLSTECSSSKKEITLVCFCDCTNEEQAKKSTILSWSIERTGGTLLLQWERSWRTISLFILVGGGGYDIRSDQISRSVVSDPLRYDIQRHKG